MTKADDKTGSSSSAKDRRNAAAASLLIVVLAGVAVFLLVLSIGAAQGNLTGESGVGRFFVLILGSAIDPKILTGVTGILGVGSAFVAGGGLSNRLFYLIVALAAVSIALSLLMMVLLAGDDLASALYNYATERIADAQSFRTAANWALGGTCLWLIGVLGLQVGLHASAGAGGAGAGADEAKDDLNTGAADEDVDRRGSDNQ